MSSSKILSFVLFLGGLITISSSAQSWVSQQSSEIVSLSFVAKGIREWENLHSKIRKSDSSENIRPLLNLTRFYMTLAQEKPMDSIMAGNQALQADLEALSSPVAFEAFLYALNAVAQNTSQGFMIPPEWRFDLVDWYLPAGLEIVQVLNGNPEPENSAKAQISLQLAYNKPECLIPRQTWLLNQEKLPEPSKESIPRDCLSLLHNAMQNSISNFTALISREWLALLLTAGNQIGEAISIVEGAHIFKEHPRLHALSTLLYLKQNNFKLAEYHRNRAILLEPTRHIVFPEPNVASIPEIPVLTTTRTTENQILEIQDKWAGIRAKIASVSGMVKTTETTSEPKSSVASLPLESTVPVISTFDNSLVPTPGTQDWFAFLQTTRDTHKGPVPKELMEHFLVWHLYTIKRDELVSLLSIPGYSRIQNPILLEFLDRLMLSEARPLDLARRYSLWLRIAQRLPAELLERLQIRLIVWQSLLGAPALKLDSTEHEILGSLASNGLLGIVFKSLQKSAASATVTSR